MHRLSVDVLLIQTQRIYKIRQSFQKVTRFHRGIAIGKVTADLPLVLDETHLPLAIEMIRDPRNHRPYSADNDSKTF